MTTVEQTKPCILAGNVLLRTLFLSAMACCLSGGCCDGDSVIRYRVEGHVNIDGVPLQKGLITFIPKSPTEGPKASGVIDEGAYVIEHGSGPCRGTFVVKIETVPRGIEAIASKKSGATKPSLSGKPRPGVAPQYNEKSQLAARVEEHGPNRFDFEVKSMKVNRPRCGYRHQ